MVSKEKYMEYEIFLIIYILKERINIFMFGIGGVKDLMIEMFFFV